ncbi:MAG: hypothetical protein FJ086_05640 [Deltaproteobacteria bacterium]|nr:hypothetical protein [Deltaproteobacteria bacterium]
MHRPRRAHAAVTLAAPEQPPALPPDGLERLRAAVKARTEPRRPSPRTFRDRLEAWLAEEL